MAGTNLYWGHGEDALRALAEARGIPVFLNGLARGCLPADHELFFSRARGDGAQGRRRRARDRRADGLPARLRRLVRRGDRDRRDRRRRARARPAARGPSRPSCYGALAATLRRARADGGRARHTSAWIAHAARRSRTRSAPAEREQLEDARAPLHPMRVYGELAEVLDRDAIVDRRRRRLRLLRRARDRLLRARLLARPGPVRLPRRRARATRSRPSSRGPTARSSCCSATAPSASPGWSSTRSPATASTSSA